jgi:NAD(P)-dependent dehydrogenase (short-subunit alcohol dehydrogenase family)
MTSASPICLITGTTRGIGRALVGVATEAGAKVISMGGSGEPLHPSVIEANVDVRESKDIARFVAGLPVDRIDFLINNAGIFPDPGIGLGDLDLGAIKDAFDVNAVGALRVTRFCLPLLSRSQTPTVVNVSSAMGSLAKSQGSASYAYRMSKAAMNMFTVALAAEFPHFRVLSVHPGHVRTEMGGSHAPVEPEASAAGIWALAQNPPSGSLFFDYLGHPIPW